MTKNNLKEKYCFLIISLGIFCLCSLCFCGCKTKYSVEKIKESEPGIQASLQIPVYEKYVGFSDYVKEELLKDYRKYKEYAIAEWDVFHQDTLTYRTEFKDMSNSKYINAFVSKYIPTGPTLEDEYILTFCYDKKNKQLVDINQITGMTIEELSSYCKKYLKRTVKETNEKYKEYLNEDIERNLILSKERYSCFSVQKDKVLVYFPSGEVVSKYYGVLCVEIPIKRK